MRGEAVKRRYGDEGARSRLWWWWHERVWWGGEIRSKMKRNKRGRERRGGTTGRRERSGAKWKRQRRENQKTRLKGEEGVSRSQK